MRGPIGDVVRRALVWGIVAAILLPILLTVVTGLAALLAALGDREGARVSGRVAILAAVAWLVAVVSTSVLAGLAVLETDGGRRRPPRGCRGRRERHRRGVGHRRRDRDRSPPRGEPRGEAGDVEGPPPWRDPRAG